MLIYTIVNNGHAGEEAYEQAVNSVLSALGASGVKAAVGSAGGAQGAGSGLAQLLGLSSAAVPFVGSALSVLANWLVPKLGGIIFADCDGPVAIGVHIYTGEQLNQSLSGGKKISETDVVHNGSDSPVGCGANSVYYTTDTVAETIQAVINLNGQWAAGGAPRPVISVTGNNFTVDMSSLHRPTALGTINDSSHITVNFPDDKTYTGTLQRPNTILWSNNSIWTNVAIQPVIALNGQWAVSGVPGPIISVSGNSISVDMSAYHRPNATGSITNSSRVKA